MTFSSQTIDEVGVLTLEYEPRNALDIDAVTELRKTFEACRGPLVITGVEGAFSAGVNTVAFESYSDKKRARFFRRISRMVAACCAISRCPAAW